MPLWSRASDKRSHVLPSPDDGPARHERSSLKRGQGGHESPAPPRPVGFRVWLWRVLVVNVVLMLAFIFSMSLYFPAISTESVVDQALMQGEHTAVPRGPQGYVNLGAAANTELDIVPASTVPAIEPVMTTAAAQERETELLAPTRTTTHPEATDDAVLATETPLASSASPAIVSAASSEVPVTVLTAQDSDQVPLSPTPSGAVEEITSVPATTPAAGIQASTAAPTAAPTIVETTSPSPSIKPMPTTQASLPKNVADLIWALKNKSKMPNAAEQSSTKPGSSTAPPSVVSEVSTKAKETNAKPSVFPASTRSTKELFVATAESPVALETESDTPTVVASTESTTQAPFVSTPPLPPRTTTAITSFPLRSTQAPAASPAAEPQPTSPFGDTNIFEWEPPAKLHADDPNREQRVIEWRQSVNEAVQSVRNSVIGGETLRSLIRQRRDELLALRQQLFG